MKLLKHVFPLLLIAVVGLFYVHDGDALMNGLATQFLGGSSDVMLGATVSLASIARKERQKSNLGGLSKAVMYGASDFTADWPVKSGITAGAITGTTIPVKVGATAAVLTFDTGTGRFKSKMGGKLGYQTFEHEFSADFAGFDATQGDALDKCYNEGAVIICFLKNGKRIVLGASYCPMVIEYEGDSGGKSDDGSKISLKAKIEDGVDFTAPELASGVTITLPA